MFLKKIPNIQFLTFRAIDYGEKCYCCKQQRNDPSVTVVHCFQLAVSSNRRFCSFVFKSFFQSEFWCKLVRFHLYVTFTQQTINAHNHFDNITVLYFTHHQHQATDIFKVISDYKQIKLRFYNYHFNQQVPGDINQLIPANPFHNINTTILLKVCQFCIFDILQINEFLKSINLLTMLINWVTLLFRHCETT